MHVIVWYDNKANIHGQNPTSISWNHHKVKDALLADKLEEKLINKYSLCCVKALNAPNVC